MILSNLLNVLRVFAFLIVDYMLVSKEHGGNITAKPRLAAVLTEAAACAKPQKMAFESQSGLQRPLPCPVELANTRDKKTAPKRR
jgi:hypothetical protein